MMKKFSAVLIFALLCLTALPSLGAEFRYKTDPRMNAHAMSDVLADPKAVYGFVPDPRSPRLGKFADAVDWHDPQSAGEARRKRIAYHESFRSMYEMLAAMRGEGRSAEEIARAVSAERNAVRIASYGGDAKGLETLRESNLRTYGHPDGPTPEWLYEKHGSWDDVIITAFSTNAGMDACLGLYDDHTDAYVDMGMITGRETRIERVVASGDCLWDIARKYYGSGAKWRQIRSMNRRKVRGTSTIFPGDVLIIPR